jgi:hypothetical protein
MRELTVCKPSERRLLSWLEPIPVAAQSKAWVWGRSLAGIEGLNPAGGMDVCCECCVLKGRGLCFGLIPRPETPCRRCVCVCVCVSLSVIKGNNE